MGAPVVDINIVRGKTFEFAYRYAESDLVYLPITGMANVAPVRLNLPAHGIPDGWPIRVECLKFPEELNNRPDGEEPYYFAKVVDESIIELNSVNAYCWKPYVSGGLVVFNRPSDITGFAARMTIKDRVGGKVLLKLSSDPLSEPDGSITIDIGLSAFIAKLSAETTEAIDWRKAVYDIEAIAPGGEVYAVVAVSAVTIQGEVTQ